jgi:hypothetical protein
MSTEELCEAVDNAASHPIDRIEAAIELGHRMHVTYESAIAMIQSIIDETDERQAQDEEEG